MNCRYSFIDLFKQKVDYDQNTQVYVSSIVIPQIQRPYAQGRTDGVSTYIRNTFLDEIFENLSSNDNEIFYLNLIYGIIKPNNDEFKLELLDGQQRLTTLFLLYWYIINAEFSLEQQESINTRECLSKFMYETRTTSTVFCQELATYKVQLGTQKPKDVIRKAKWYFKSFDRDSTISAMLTMLDSIHERYCLLENKNVFVKLQNLQFYVKSLGLFNLSEELYIKMNARGLQLSPFENFKADLTNFVSNKDFVEFKTNVPLYKNGSVENVPFHFNLSLKLDAKWVDIFWKNGAKDFDDSYMSFFTRYFACKYIISSKNHVSDRDMRADKTIKTFYTNAEEQIGSNEYFGFKVFECLLNEHPEYIVSLDKVLDTIYQHDYKSEEKVIYKNMLPVWERTPENQGDDFYCNISVKMSHIKLIAFAAVIEYVEAMDSFDSSTFVKWMRVVWNIIENTNIDSLTPVSSLIRKFSAVIHFIAGKMKEGHEFYKSLSQWHIENATERENRALLEEVEKSKRISEDSSWESIWMDVEQHPYFKGMVTFFYKSGMSQQDYIQNSAIAKSMFDGNGVSADYKKDHLLIRAIISQFNTWGEINELYITEKSENNKYLKNILASNDKVRSMLADVTSSINTYESKSKLQQYIINADKPQAWPNASQNDIIAFEMATNRIRNDIKMYDWICKEEENLKACFRIYWYEGHIMFAVPRKQFAKIALDTERAKIAHELCNCFGFDFEDENQKLMYEQYNDCFGNYIWLKQDRFESCIRLGFDQHLKLKIHIVCKTKMFAEKLVETLKNGSYIMEETTTVILPELYHSKMDETYPQISSILETLFDAIPES